MGVMRRSAALAALIVLIAGWAALAAAAAVSLASVGPEKTRIEIVPSENPRTGKLSYLSAVAMLRELGASVQVGS